MLKLHGAPLSNYYNMAKALLLEKRLPFEEVMAAPSQQPAFLEISPMGKIPVLQTEQAHRRIERFFSELVTSADDNDTPRTVVTPCASHSL